ncbi:MAG: hypothetical protein VX278_18725 [Myxococcota bacterium]|nr:hypothetical protein [Myxococcota bacterium]
MEPNIRALNAEEEAELDRYLIHGLELLPIKYEEQEGDFLLLAVQMVIDAVRLGEEPPKGVSIADLCTWLGVVWGDELCDRLGWNWFYVRMPSGFEGAAIVAHDRKSCCFPIHCIHRWATDTTVANRCMLLLEELGKERSSAPVFQVFH